MSPSPEAGGDALASSPAASRAVQSRCCTNCGLAFAALFGDATPAYCPACGQESNVQPPTLRELAQQFGGAYLSTEGALWRTLKLLLTRPGELTVQYLAGRRKHYVLPLRLYLTVSVVVLLLLRFLGGAAAVKGLDDPRLATAVTAAKPSVMLTLYGSRAGLRDGTFYCFLLPDLVCERLRQRIESNPRAFVEDLRLLNERLVANLGTLMFVMLPVFALGLHGLYRNRQMRYTAHLVHALHLHAFWFLMLPVLLIGHDAVMWLGAAVMMVYAILAGRRVYGGRLWPRLLRAALMVLLYSTVLLALVPFLVLLAFLQPH
jgi:hypothetical protein